MAEKKEEKRIDVRKDHLSNPRTRLWLGALVSVQLQAVGTITLFLGEDGKVRVANPLHVYLGPQAMIDDESEDERPFRWVRPVIGEAKPQFAAWRDDTLWEIEFTDGHSSKEETGD